MNENAGDENTVTGKAMGNILGMGAAALMIGGGAFFGISAIGKSVNGAKKAAGEIKKVASKVDRKVASVIDPLSSQESKYVRQVQGRNGIKDIYNKPANKQAEEYGKHMISQNAENKKAFNILNDDLYKTLEKDNAPASVIQTSMLEQKTDGSIGRIADEQLLKNNNQAHIQQSTAVNNNLDNQMSMFGMKNEVSPSNGQTSMFASDYKDNVKVTGKGRLNNDPQTDMFGSMAQMEPKVVEKSISNNDVSQAQPNRKVRRGRGQNLAQPNTSTISSSINDGNINELIKSRTGRPKQKDAHQYIKPGSVDYGYLKNKNMIGNNRTGQDRVPSWVTNTNR